MGYQNMGGVLKYQSRWLWQIYSLSVVKILREYKVRRRLRKGEIWNLCHKFKILKLRGTLARSTRSTRELPRLVF